MSEKKATGIQKPLNVSAALAKIIGTKKGEQVTLRSKSKSPKFIHTSRPCVLLLSQIFHPIYKEGGVSK